MADNDTNDHITRAVFRQLHVKLPTPGPSEDPDGRVGSTSSAAWLKKHANGFLLMHSLKRHYPIGKSLLVESVDTDELFVNKRFRRSAPHFSDRAAAAETFGNPVARVVEFTTPQPPELRFSTLQDPRVQVILPDESYFPKLHAYGCPNGPVGHTDEEQQPSDVFSLFFKHYNGGTLGNLREMYHDSNIGAPIPESLIWHVMEQITRVVLFLHFGYTRDHLDQYISNPRPQKQKPVKGWRPIVHRAIQEQNVLLHFSDNDDDGNDSEDSEGRHFPQIILEGFDKAVFSDDPRRYWVQDTPASQDPGYVEVGPSAGDDIHQLFELLRRMVVFPPASNKDDEGSIERGDGSRLILDAYCIDCAFTADSTYRREYRRYSSDLIELLKKWEPHMTGEYPGDQLTSKSKLPFIKPPQWLLTSVLPKAIERVTHYRNLYRRSVAGGRDTGNEGAGDVSWVMPDPTFERIPFATPRFTEESSLQVLRYELSSLFGPYIPVWYRYDAVDVSAILPDQHELYAIDTLPVGQNGEDAGVGEVDERDQGNGDLEEDDSEDDEGDDEDSDDGDEDEDGDDDDDEDEDDDDGEAEEGDGDDDGVGEDEDNDQDEAMVGLAGSQPAQALGITKSPKVKTEVDTEPAAAEAKEAGHEERLGDGAQAPARPSPKVKKSPGSQGRGQRSPANPVPPVPEPVPEPQEKKVRKPLIRQAKGAPPTRRSARVAAIPKPQPAAPAPEPKVPAAPKGKGKGKAAPKAKVKEQDEEAETADAPQPKPPAPKGRGKAATKAAPKPKEPESSSSESEEEEQQQTAPTKPKRGRPPAKKAVTTKKPAAPRKAASQPKPKPKPAPLRKAPARGRAAKTKQQLPAVSEEEEEAQPEVPDKAVVRRVGVAVRSLEREFAKAREGGRRADHAWIWDKVRELVNGQLLPEERLTRDHLWEEEEEVEGEAEAEVASGDDESDDDEAEDDGSDNMPKGAKRGTKVKRRG